jgi:hypothetical protein
VHVLPPLAPAVHDMVVPEGAVRAVHGKVVQDVKGLTEVLPVSQLEQASPPDEVLPASQLVQTPPEPVEL